MPTTEYLFIHPWLNPDESWAGFQISFSGDAESYAEALAQLSALPAVQALDQRLHWLLPASTEAHAGPAQAFPHKQAILVLQAPPGTGIDADWDEFESSMRLTGRKLALALASDTPLPPTGAWSHVIVAASRARTLPAFSLLGLATKTTIAVTGLLNHNDFIWATANHCSLVTPEYLLNRSQPGNRPDMVRLRLLKLLGLIVEDADTCEIEEIFRQEPKLAYGLLRLVNSAAMGPRTPISSFGQAITILGRQQLQRWLQLLVYADPNNDQHPNPLLLQAALRGRLMETLAPAIHPQPEVSADIAFMIGTFSLLDVLLNLSMPDILLQLPLPDFVHTALEEHHGPLGQLLLALAAADNRDVATAGELLSELGIDRETYTAAQINALEWASKIRPNA